MRRTVVVLLLSAFGEGTWGEKGAVEVVGSVFCGVAIGGEGGGCLDVELVLSGCALVGFGDGRLVRVLMDWTGFIYVWEVERCEVFEEVRNGGFRD